MTTKTNLTRASRELFRRAPDETFPSLLTLAAYCREQKQEGQDRWYAPKAVKPITVNGLLKLFTTDGEAPLAMNDWSFGQFCGLARVHKETVNRLTPATAATVLAETMPAGNKPIQLYAAGSWLRSVHGMSYSRLHNADLLSVVSEFAVDFQPPPAGIDGKTGLYAGEQDMFCFLIDPTGWAEVEGEAFAPGFFVWNSEVGKRSVGIQTFWFQAVCRNHIVWDAVEVTEVTRKHTGNVGDALGDIRRAIESLVAKRDERRDTFAAAIKKAMATTLGADADEVLKVLSDRGVGARLGKRAVEIARGQGRFTVFSVVDALTRLAGEHQNAGDRAAADQQAARLLELVSPRPTKQLDAALAA